LCVGRSNSKTGVTGEDTDAIKRSEIVHAIGSQRRPYDGGICVALRRRSQTNVVYSARPWLTPLRLTATILTRSGRRDAPASAAAAAAAGVSRRVSYNGVFADLSLTVT